MWNIICNVGDTINPFKKIYKMIKQLKNGWLVLLFSAILVVIGNMAFSIWETNKEKREGAASVEYVDQENIEQDEYTVSQNEKQDCVILRVQADLKNKVEIREFENLKDDIVEIRKQTNEIYKLLIPKK